MQTKKKSELTITYNEEEILHCVLMDAVRRGLCSEKAVTEWKPVDDGNSIIVVLEEESSENVDVPINGSAGPKGKQA